jgi:hypothetical protein
MRASNLFRTILAMHALRRPCLIEGAPGLGKTQIVQQAAKELGIGFIHCHAPTMQPEDFAIPAPNADRTGINFLVNTRFPMEGSDHPDEGILLIDELPQGDNAIQKTSANLIQEREIYGKRLKPGWTIMATGNRAQDRAGANRVLSHLSNRVTRIDFEPHLEDWCTWAIDNGVDHTVVAFLRFKPNMLHAFDPQQTSSPTPRAWTEGVSPVIGKVPAECEVECFKGAVGEGAAAEFVGFLRIARELPNPDAVLLSPKEAEVPTKPATLYAISGAIAARATVDNFDAVATYAKRLPPEFMIMVFRDAVQRSKEIMYTRPFTEWAAKEGSKVLL